MTVRQSSDQLPVYVSLWPLCSGELTCRSLSEEKVLLQWSHDISHMMFPVKAAWTEEVFLSVTGRGNLIFKVRLRVQEELFVFMYFSGWKRGTKPEKHCRGSGTLNLFKNIKLYSHSISLWTVVLFRLSLL